VKTKVPEPAGTGEPPADSGPGLIQVVEFILGSERFAIHLFDVREVVEYTTITRLPGKPAFVRGIINLRGEITTIVDLKQRLNITDTGTTPAGSSRIIVLDETIGRSKTGILVDDVTSVSTFEGSQVDYTYSSAGRGDTSIIGIIRHKARDRETCELIIWIDIRKLLSGIEVLE
jgi:purine-binding chemotaxis protein CheW